MNSTNGIPVETTLEVRDTCLCLHVHRAARAMARRFDDAFRSLGLTHGQFSLLMSLNGPVAPDIGKVSETLAMDRTTLTANLKPLERRGLLEVRPGAKDRRTRLLYLTDAGRALLIEALPIWRSQHSELHADLPSADPDALRRDLSNLSFGDQLPAALTRGR